MNNLPLQPLPWESVAKSGGAANDAQGAGIYYRAIQRDGKHIVYWVDSMGGSDGDKSFDSWDELKEWVETTHYPHKMQPYVKPMPTWISVDNRLPESRELLTDKDKCLVLTECGKVWTGFYNMHIKPDDWYLHGWTEKQGWYPFKIVAWMLASEFSTTQNLHKGVIVSEFENEVRVLNFTKKGSLHSATVKINVEIDVMIGYSGTSENAAKDALMSQALNQLRTDVLGEGYE